MHDIFSADFVFRAVERGDAGIRRAGASVELEVVEIQDDLGIFVSGQFFFPDFESEKIEPHHAPFGRPPGFQ